MIPEFRSYYSSVDWLVVLLVSVVGVIGIFVLYSASYDPDIERKIFLWTLNSRLAVKQATFLLVGLGIMLVVASLPSRWCYRFSYPFYLLFFSLLIAVMLFGKVSNGSQRWIVIGSLYLQPSELMKVGVILALSRYLAKNPPKQGVYGLGELVVPSLIFVAPMILILAQPDLGTALSVGAIGGIMILAVGVKRWVLGSGIVAGVFGAFAAWNWVLLPYQKRRVLTLFDPDADPHGSGYQIIQSKIAVGSGELFGKGYLEGSQTRLEFVPERTTDFIFCVLAEEWGFIGALCVLSLYLFLLLRVLHTTSKSKDSFAILVGVGVVALIFFHAFVNLGMVVGFLPVVGIPLPLLSYGGSSLLTTLFAIGLVLSVTAHRSFLRS